MLNQRLRLLKIMPGFCRHRRIKLGTVWPWSAPTFFCGPWRQYPRVLNAIQVLRVKDVIEISRFVVNLFVDIVVTTARRRLVY
jgi:hypothetical protein